MKQRPFYSQTTQIRADELVSICVDLRNLWMFHPCFIRVSSVALILFGPTLVSVAQTSSEDTNALKLLPPYGELPLTFWERFGPAIIALAILILVIAAFIAWLVLSPRRQASLPPAVEAQRALESLRAKPEDGACLSDVSQILRHYFVSAFDLSINEPTTEEFRRAISGCKEIGDELSVAVTEFLRECDERKFSLADPKVPIGAVDRALRFIAQAEARQANPGSAVVSTECSNDTSTRRQDAGAPRE